MKTVKQMVEEIRKSGAEFVTYGDGDLGTPVSVEEAIQDIENMDDDMIGEGTWLPCDEDGRLITEEPAGAQVSVNNGGTFYTADEIDEEMLLKYWDELSEAMEETLCEQLHGNSGTETERGFLRKYLELANDDLVIG